MKKHNAKKFENLSDQARFIAKSNVRKNRLQQGNIFGGRKRITARTPNILERFAKRFQNSGRDYVGTDEK